jgi:hypothetical protein
MNQLSIEKHILDNANMPTDNEIDTLPRRLVNMMRHVPVINFCWWTEKVRTTFVVLSWCHPITSSSPVLDVTQVLSLQTDRMKYRRWDWTEDLRSYMKTRRVYAGLSSKVNVRNRLRPIITESVTMSSRTYSINNYQKITMENANEWLIFAPGMTSKSHVI